MKISSILIIIIVILNVSCAADSSDVYKQLSNNNKHIRYTGRTKTTETATQLCYSGSSVEFTIIGKTAMVTFEDLGMGGAQHINYIEVEINGKPDSTIQLQTSKKEYDLSNLLKADTNAIKLIKRTEASVGKINFYGLKIKTNDYLTENKVYNHKILWIGNSLTCGYGNEISIEPPPKGNPSTGFHAKNENNYFSWSSITARKFNAETHQVCYSGKGIYRNFDDSRTSTLPQLFNHTFPDDQLQKWNHDRFQPDLIIINLSTNDFGPEMSEKENLCDSSLFVSTYISFVNELLLDYPHSKIILTIGNALNDLWPAGLNRLSRARSYIKTTANNCSNQNRVGTFELTIQKAPYGEDWHPTIKTHSEMSNQIAIFIKTTMNW